jgi:hypothetical protein
MSWAQTKLHVLADLMRFAAIGFLTIDAILLALFSTWFVARLLWQLVKLLDRTWFGTAW